MLMSLGLQKQVWVYMQPTDMRKQFDSLHGLVRSFHSHPLNGDVFLFLSKDRKKAKALYWDGNGLVLVAKRLEQGCFAAIFHQGTMSLSELALFL